MPKRYKKARLMHKAKLTKMATKLGVSQPTLSAWESERKSAPVEAVIKMATLYGVTTDYLLGLDDTVSVMPGQPISVQCIKLFHEKPVWSSAHGWMLVNAINETLCTADGNTLSFTEAGKLFTAAAPFAEAVYPSKNPLPVTTLAEHTLLWVEPISVDEYLKNELRGYYHVKQQYVENDAGNRFLFNSYGVKWLAFEYQSE